MTLVYLSCQWTSSFPRKVRLEPFRIERDWRASPPPAAADPGSASPSAVQPQPVDPLPSVPHHEAHAGHQGQGAHNRVQLCQQTWKKQV